MAPPSDLKCLDARGPDVGGEMKHETSTALHDYWRSCRRDAGVPPLGIRAAELAPILPSLFLVDLDEASGLRFRYCGAALIARYGRDLAGESFLELWNADDRETLALNLRAMAARSTGLVAGVMAETVGAGFTSFEMLLLPLSSESGAAGAIGSMVRIGGHEEANRIRARLVGQWLRSIRFLPRADAAACERPTVPGPQPPSPSQARRRYGHLTVVAGGKRAHRKGFAATLTDI